MYICLHKLQEKNMQTLWINFCSTSFVMFPTLLGVGKSLFVCWLRSLSWAWHNENSDMKAFSSAFKIGCPNYNDYNDIYVNQEMFFFQQIVHYWGRSLKGQEKRQYRLQNAQVLTKINGKEYNKKKYYNIRNST